MSLRSEIGYSGARVSLIEKTFFGIKSAEDILRESVCEVYNHIATVYDKQDGHLFDRKMGTSDRSKENALSKLPMKWDPGHFGHIRLEKPVYQIPFLPNIISILNVVCHRCSSGLVDAREPERRRQILARKGKARFAYYQSLLKDSKLGFNKNCWNCGACVLKFVKDTKDGSPKINVKGGMPSLKGASPPNILADVETCEKQAAKGAAADVSQAQQSTDAVDGDGGDGEGGDSGEGDGKKTQFNFMNPEVVHTIFRKITDDDCELLGYPPQHSRPESMIWTVMPVPPPPMRPAVTNESGQTADDDLTYKLNDIIKTNNQIRDLLSKEQSEKERRNLYNWWSLLQYHVATYVDNEISNIPAAVNRSGRAYRTLRQRLNHKEGRVRGNLMGKRVDKSARSVITPDPNISIDELGVPFVVADVLTREEIVTPLNVKRLTQLVRNGPKWPGANCIEYKSSSDLEQQMGGQSRGSFKCSLKHITQMQRDKIVLNPGDVVHRHLMNGDIVLFNRQPSLHKMSMMGHRAKILPGKTFRLNPSVCTPYNADFDGDEMNMHVPNSKQASYELQALTLVPTQIVSPQASKPVMGLIQDALLASYRFTRIRSKPHLNLMHLMTLLDWTSGYDGSLPDPSKPEPTPIVLTPEVIAAKEAVAVGTGTEVDEETLERELHEEEAEEREELEAEEQTGRSLRWDSKHVFSTFLPKVSYYLNRNEDGAEQEQKNILRIEDGKMSSGFFDKQTFGTKNNSLVHVTWNDWGPEPTRHLFDDMMNVGMQWLAIDGFSVGLDDMYISRSDYDEIHHQVREKVAEAKVKIEFLHQGRYPIIGEDQKRDFHKAVVHELGYWLPRDRFFFSDTGKPINEQFEADIYVVLNGARKIAEEATGKKLSPDNRMASMVESGSKGSKTNLVQIISLLGQQELDGGRVPDGYLRRTLPHFTKDSITPESRGFIDKGYLLGLDVTQYFFHAMAGRVGVISTSIKTAETGYLQRRLMKALEDLGVRYDWSVRNANDIILQFFYGGDGFDASRLEVQKFDYLTLSDDKFRKIYRYNPFDTAHPENLFAPNIVADLEDDPAKYSKILEEEFQRLSKDRDILRTEVFKHGVPDKILLPVNFPRMIENFQYRFALRKGSGLADLNPAHVVLEVRKLIAKILEEYQVPTFNENRDFIVLQAMIRSHLASKKLAHKGYNKEAFDYLIQDVYRKFQEAFAAPGEMVGAIAAQSVGEPSTQMTLDTFHSTGVGEKANVSRGVPRLKEIMRVTSALETPTVTVSINPTYLNQKRSEDDESKLEPKDRAMLNAQELASNIEFTTMRDIVNSVKIIYAPDLEEGVTDYSDADKGFLESYNEFMGDLLTPEKKQEFPWVIRMDFQERLMAQKNITMEDVYAALVKEQGTTHPGFKDIKEIQFAVSDTNGPLDGINVGGDSLYVARINVQNESIRNNPINLVRYLERVLLEIKVKGIPGIDTARVRFVKQKPFYAENGSLDHTFDYEIDTNGVNLVDIWNMRHINPEATFSNHIIEVYETLGINAARNLIIDEITEVMEYAGTYVNPRHIEILADLMTSRGYLISVDRHGMSKGDSGPWARASFEETTTQIFRSAMYGESDPMSGVSSNIMTGQFIKAGTNAFRIGLDETMIQTVQPPKQDMLLRRQQIAESKEKLNTEKANTVAEYCDQSAKHSFNFTFDF